MGANHSGESRKRHQKRSLKNWHTRKHTELWANVTTIRGATFRRGPEKAK
jgi:hypothetical protein